MIMCTSPEQDRLVLGFFNKMHVYTHPERLGYDEPTILSLAGEY